MTKINEFGEIVRDGVGLEISPEESEFNNLVYLFYNHKDRMTPRQLQRYNELKPKHQQNDNSVKIALDAAKAKIQKSSKQNPLDMMKKIKAENSQ
ncbi:MAG: hypothetical protein LBL75_00630 [Rickettsiales bacterium]|jgi:precorrin-3B methylase|nr:hypothetical protein [Rickettsiales bacterium]